MTSANVIEYRIFNAAGKQVGKHSYNVLCKPDWKKLLKFEPLDKHTIQSHGKDEEEATWEDPPVNLRLFLLSHRVIQAQPSDPPLQLTVYNGTERVIVPRCCDGHVKVVSTFEAEAFRNLVEAPKFVGKSMHCMACGRMLPATRETDIKPR